MRPASAMKIMAGQFWSFYLPALLSVILLMAPTVAPAEEDILEILRQRIDVEKRGVGIVVGYVDDNGTRVIPYGKMSLPDGKPVDGRTIFEIGSITKVFTSLLLAEAVERGEIKLDDPVQKYLPPDVEMPTRNGQEIQLIHLSTHHSSLPRLPDNMNPSDITDPYVDYTLQQMYDFLSNYNLTRDIGSEFEYSNLGVALLGQVFINRAGKDYQSLLREEICEVLNMTESTWINPIPENLEPRMATGHIKNLTAVGNWHLGVFAGAGGICSDVEDMLKFLMVNMNENGPLGPAIKMTHQVRADGGDATTDIGLGWLINRLHPPAIIWHNGGTGGYRSFTGFDPERRRGVVVLSNSEYSVDDIGLHLLNPEYELSPPPEK